MQKIAYLWKVIVVSTILVSLYVFWTHSLNSGNLLIISAAALCVSFLFVAKTTLPAITPKKVFYGIAYVGYLLLAIIRSTLDVARRVVQKEIPLNPGIVKVKTRLKSKAGRMILANSITLTPGTLSVDVQGNDYFIHWIDITAMDQEEATKEIVAGFEKYLEVIFG